MRKAFDYLMIAVLIFLTGSGTATNKTESLLHEICGITLFVCVALHLILNRKWFTKLFKGKYSGNRIALTVTDVLLIVTVILIIVSSVVVSRYIFSFLGASGTLLARRIHLVGTAWMLVICGIHYGLHLKKEWWNYILYAFGAGGIAAIVYCKFYERLFLISEFAFTPRSPQWLMYLLYALIFLTFVTLGSLLKRIVLYKRKSQQDAAEYL